MTPMFTSTDKLTDHAAMHHSVGHIQINLDWSVKENWTMMEKVNRKWRNLEEHMVHEHTPFYLKSLR